MSQITRPAPEIDKAVERLLHQGAHIHVLNTTIVPPGADGLWRVVEVDISYIRHILLWLGHSGAWGFVNSHVGHESTARIASELLQDRIDVDRRPWDGSGIGIAIQLKGRPEEGKILSREEVERVGYVLRLVYRESEGVTHEDTTESDVRLRQFAEVLRPIVGLLRHNSQGLHDKLFDAYDQFVDRLPSGPA